LKQYRNKTASGYQINRGTGTIAQNIIKNNTLPAPTTEKPINPTVHAKSIASNKPLHAITAIEKNISVC
jgi:hypothetical protein